MENKGIEIGSFVKVVRGELSGGIYKVFDKSFSGLTLRIGINSEKSQYKVQIDDIELVTEEEYRDYNHDILMQDVSFI